MKNDNPQSIFKQLVSLLITICIIGLSGAAFGMQTPKQQREVFIDYLKEEQERYKTFFDQESLLDELDYDTDNIIDFVSNKIVYQAYDGVLRGAKGTLIGRAGNSHDQAITLAGMLNDTGLEAEILVGKLTAEQATELNLTIASPKFNALKDTISSSKSILAKKISAKAEELVKSEGESISTIMKETDVLANRIFQQLPEEEIKNGMEAFKESVQNSAIPYRWVRYRLAQGDKWIEVHPAYVGAAKWELTPGSFEKNKVTPKDLQQFSVEVWIENSDGEKHSITGLWKKPAANLLDHTLSIEIGSDAMMKPALSNKPDEMFKQSHFFFIQIDGKLPKEGKVFDLNGNIYSGDSLSGLNSVFSTLNKKTQKAADALSSLSFDKNKPETNSKKQLVKVWLEFTLEKPNAENRMIKRVIFEGEALSEASKAAMRLLQRWDIDVATTTPMRQYYQNTKSKQVVSALEGAERLQAYFKSKPNTKEREAIAKYDLMMGNHNIGLLTHKRSMFDRFEVKDTIVSYIHEPNILAIRHGIKQSIEGWKMYEMTDIISNNRWSVRKSNKHLIPAPRISINRGIWETRTESTRAIEKKKVIHNDSAFESLIESQDYVLKKHTEFNAKLFTKNEQSWWDIDLKTGRAIGMIELKQGSGGGVASEEMLMLSMTVSFAFMLGGTINCKGAGNDALCCVLWNSLTMAAGAGIGYIIAYKFATAIILVTDALIIDSTFFFVPTPCPKA